MTRAAAVRYRTERCPEAAYGYHGEPNTVGRCPYCGAHLGRARVGPGRPEPEEVEFRLQQRPAEPCPQCGVPVVEHEEDGRCPDDDGYAPWLA